MNPEDIVLAFAAAWNALDHERIYALMADDIFYHNMPFKPVRGRDNVRAHLARWPVDSCAWTITNISARGGIVLTERVDRFTRGRDLVVIPVMGAFEVIDGRIAQWRDYFDKGAMTPQAVTGSGTSVR